VGAQTQESVRGNEELSEGKKGRLCDVAGSNKKEGKKVKRQSL